MQRKLEIKKRILEHFKDAKTELVFSNDYELLIAVMLSAQCLDSRVNLITPSLFSHYKNAQELANANLMSVKELIKSCNFYQNKAKNLILMAKEVCNKHNGKIPLNYDDLISLAGVGKKTAKVVLAESLGLNYFPVDTHIFRVAHRLKLSNKKTPDECSTHLEKVFKSDLAKLHQAMVLFGRYICKAKKPECSKCFLSDLCNATCKQENL
ncbi:endonuclease III [Campylobacter canadensis]|uniref:Endonuclease III n=1 Tax=Campylobacter canadensis TaxID=449520 RepID=A0ABS7WT07_9BACT|nr:endonuclease III [Campylobacter canadensis]MBZ7987427.1 endonuclease III [Campylobacter canadensis]MBZ7995261.1 endonuclease III [Campylobacter canadensis]MBZ7996774.1 endonuclease III [Campylobacter canadensis]MBZ7998622.1 endonuclease III [Campylobacter canadensis]MBZ8000645.1 endonuclease III [Campylobacter canadensis]